MLPLEEFFPAVDDAIEILRKNRIVDIKMLFGWRWGEWETIHTTVNEIGNEIKKQEAATNLEFGDNDVIIEIKELDTQIVFCHEADLHIEFNETNPVVIDILKLWKEKNLIHLIRKNGEEASWEDIHII